MNVHVPLLVLAAAIGGLGLLVVAWRRVIPLILVAALALFIALWLG